MAYRKVMVGTEIKQLVSYNPKRLSLVIYNFGTDRIFISDNPTNVLDEGFPLEAGASISFHKAFGDRPEVALWGIAASGCQDIRIVEGYE